MSSSSGRMFRYWVISSYRKAYSKRGLVCKRGWCGMLEGLTIYPQRRKHFATQDEWMSRNIWLAVLFLRTSQYYKHTASVEMLFTAPETAIRVLVKALGYYRSQIPFNLLFCHIIGIGSSEMNFLILLRLVSFRKRSSEMIRLSVANECPTGTLSSTRGRTTLS